MLLRGRGSSAASDNIARVLCSDILTDYELWLTGTPLAARTRTNYRRWVAELVEDLAAGDELAAFLSPAGEHELRALLTAWRRRHVDRGLAPATINLALAAATSLLGHAGHHRPLPRAARNPLPLVSLRQRG